MAPPGKEFHRLLALALPLILVQVGLKLLGVVDNAMIGHAPAEAGGEKAFAAVALGTFYVFGSSVFFMGVLMAVDPLLSQAAGAGDRTAFARGVQRGVVLAALVTVPAMLILVPAEPVFHALRVQDPEVIRLAGTYVRLNIPSLLPFFLFVVLRQALQARDVVAPVLGAVLLANFGNVILNRIFIFGGLGVPPLGVAGAAIATSLSRWTMFVLLVVLAWRHLRHDLRPWHPEAVDGAALRRIVRLGSGIGAQFVLEWGVFGAATVAMSQIGARETAGHQVALDLASTSFMVPLGISAAASVRVGQAVGAGDRARAFAVVRSALLLCGAVMALSGGVFAAMPGTLAGFYTDKAEVALEATRLIPIAALFQVFDGLQVAAIGCLRGMGDVRYPVLVNLLGFWALGFPLGWYLMRHAGLGPAGMWWGLTAGLVSVSILLLFRLRARARRPVGRLEVEGGRGPAGEAPGP